MVASTWYFVEKDGVPSPLDFDLNTQDPHELATSIWEEWFNDKSRFVAKDEVTPKIIVSTTFLMVNLQPEPSTTPSLYETRVFGGTLDGLCLTAQVREYAQENHDSLVAKVRTEEGLAGIENLRNKRQSQAEWGF